MAPGFGKLKAISKGGRSLFDSSDGAKIVHAYKDKIDLGENLNEYEIQEKSIHFAMSKLETLLTPQELD